ncbi:ABC transporter ATP-binding protein [Actinospica sp. MGRD01-02]|uniref:ABC transporter ATP-binding protein n=1 Tax=Actinospica acidithermotolerans TaxID=2828514 RepID=A0A941E8K9_9ACTN|nr:ABC transporter ATP-binding protein [Actinospica acidithermotolerans]MBR7827046.1 ABC transporter ATP-binding protein [Actinospica acidithermotolerans]
MTALQCRDVTVGHAGVPALDGLSLTVGAGELLAILGSSGSGKTTLLHTIAGFIPPLAGEIWLADRLVAGGRRTVPPEHRSVGVVFQHYALWPHMSVLDTVAYPLRRSGGTRGQARSDAAELLGDLHIEHLAHRRPSELSGGEQQRVALARALARHPAVYLFDEPTAHLDAPLRGVVLDEVADQRKQQGTAALYATHDAAEALALADRVAVLDHGRLVQLGTPTEVYERPASLAVARLAGPASVLAAEPGSRDRTPRLVRPDWVGLDRASLGEGGAWEARVTAVAFHGPHTDYRLETEAGELLAREPGPARFSAGERVRWSLTRSWPLADASRFPEASQPATDVPKLA